MIIGLDSVSRLNLYRQMPKTLAYLQNDMEAIEYFGFNKIGDGTFPNLVGLLTGLHVDEIKQICWRKKTDRFDNCTFVWSKFHAAGYATGFAEEMARCGLFTYNMAGFIKQPVTHYWENYNFEFEKELDMGWLYAERCHGVNPSLPYLLDYNLKFVRAYQKAKRNFFAIFWESSMTHQNLNYDPRIDDFYIEFFKDLQDTNILNNTILFVMSDHGLRFGDIMNTYQGRLEVRLPFLFILVPSWFEKKYEKIHYNININAKRYI